MKISKLQIVLIIAAVGVFLILFNLPRGVIKKDREVEAGAESQSGPLPSPIEEFHTSDMSEKDKTSIESLRKEYYSVSIKEKKIKFADSLTAYFRKAQLFDSSAKYASEAAMIEPTAERLETAGDAFAEASALATENQKEKHTERSRDYYNKILKNDPKNLEVKSKLALTYIGSENPMQGINMLREVLKTDPKNETAIFNLGILSLQSGQYKKAIDRFKDLIKINPMNANAHFYLGMSFLNTGEKQNARVAFKAAQALESDPAFQATVDTYLKEVDH